MPWIPTALVFLQIRPLTGAPGLRVQLPSGTSARMSQKPFGLCASQTELIISLQPSLPAFPTAVGGTRPPGSLHQKPGSHPPTSPTMTLLQSFTSLPILTLRCASVLITAPLVTFMAPQIDTAPPSHLYYCHRFLMGLAEFTSLSSPGSSSRGRLRSVHFYIPGVHTGFRREGYVNECVSECTRWIRSCCPSSDSALVSPQDSACAPATSCHVLPLPLTVADSGYPGIS